MNEKITNQIEEMKKQTIGVEVEMNSITREKAARLAAKFFGTGRYQNTAERNGYYTWSASFVGGDMDANPCPIATTLKPIFSRFCTI